MVFLTSMITTIVTIVITTVAIMMPIWPATAEQ
jgi:hypothetical protein